MNPKVKHKIGKSAPLIFTCVSVCGVFGTAVLSVRAGMKAERILSELDQRPDDIKKYIEKTWKCYIFVIAAALGTSASIIASHKLSTKQIAALSSVAAAGATTFNEYRNKVRDAIGVDAERDLYNEVRAKADLQMYPEIPNSDSKDCSFLFYDGFSKRYFYSNHERVQQAIYHLNRMFQLKGDVSVNDWYLFNGIDGIKDGDDIIWDSDDFWEQGLVPWLDVYFQNVATEDGEICHQIFFEFEPEMIDRREFR